MILDSEKNIHNFAQNHSIYQFEPGSGHRFQDPSLKTTPSGRPLQVAVRRKWRVFYE